jgi:hypothetical protein
MPFTATTFQLVLGQNGQLVEFPTISPSLKWSKSADLYNIGFS